MTESEFKRIAKVAPHKAWAAFRDQKKEIERLKEKLEDTQNALNAESQINYDLSGSL